MDGAENSDCVHRTPRRARDVKPKSRKKRKAQPEDVNELTNLLFLLLLFITLGNRLCSSERFPFALLQLKCGAVFD